MILALHIKVASMSWLDSFMKEDSHILAIFENFTNMLDLEEKDYTCSLTISFWKIEPTASY